MNRIVVLMFFCAPHLAYAAGLDLSAIDLAACKNWIISDYHATNPNEDKPDGKVPGGYWSWLSAYIDGSNPIEEYAARCFSSDDGTFTCDGDKDFRLGRATFKPTQDTSGLTTYKCIGRCETAQVKTIYSHGWESDVENTDYLRDRKKAIKRCDKKAKGW